MFSVRIHQFGGPEVLIYEPTELPQLQPGQVRIKTRSIGVNPIDLKTRAGGGAKPFLPEPPLILGWECAGEVVEVGPGVSELQQGDRVAGLLNFPEQGACYATEVIAAAEQLAKVPEGLDMSTVGALPLAGLTALQALKLGGDLNGKRVLVLAAAGGVGHLAVQLAKQQGAWVAATASGENADFLQQLGVDQLIDYRQGSLDELVEPVDFIFDGMGAETGISALRVLAKDGLQVTLPSVTAADVVAVAEQQEKQAVGCRVAPDAAGLAVLLSLLANQQLSLCIRERFSLEQAADAHQAASSGHGRGKLVLIP